jgi:hypothetical protein
VIEAMDVEYALGKIRANTLAPLGVCRITRAVADLKA